MKRALCGGLLAVTLIYSLHAFQDQILPQILKNDKTAKIFLPAIEFIDPESFHQFHYGHANTGSNSWLRSAVYLANKDGKLAFELANYFKSINRTHQQLLWLEKASKLQHVEAAFQYIDDLIKRQELDRAKRILERDFLSTYEKTHHQLVKLALLNGDEFAFTDAYQNLAELNPNTALIATLSNVSIFNQRMKPEASCDISFTPIATNLSGIIRLEKLLEQSKKTRFTRHVCFNPISYVPIDQLHCMHESDQRIDCNIKSLEQGLADTMSKYLLVMVPQGGANVNNGVLYLDQRDSLDVFSHELAHILGFIDEYPIPENHVRCSEEQAPFSHNVAIINTSSLVELSEQQRRKRILENVPWRDKILASTPVYSISDNKIEVGTPVSYQNVFGLFKTNTCNKQPAGNSLQAFKPLLIRSKMEYFELGFPEAYWQLFEENISLYLMPAFFSSYKETAP